MNDKPKSDNPFADLDDGDLDATLEIAAKEGIDTSNIAPVAPRLYWEKCRKCNGTGTFYTYTGRSLGPCRACKGKGKKGYRQPRETREANNEARKKREAQQQLDNWDAFKKAQPRRSEWIMAKSSKFDFALSMFNAVLKYGDLTDKQVAAIDKCIARDETRTAEAQARKDAAPSIEFSKIKEAFSHAKASGLKWPKLRLDVFTFSPASDHSKNAGAIYVKEGSIYLGKIMDGKFFKVRDCSDDQEAQIIKVVADPKASAEAHGVQTGMCSCCGAELTNPESIRLGIGPICRGKWGF